LTPIIWRGTIGAVNCEACGHASHAPKPCPACAVANTTCWQEIRIVGGDGDQLAQGRIELATGVETRPCMMCRRWDNVGRKRMADYFIARGLEVQPDGTFKTPIAKDFPGRKSLVIDPSSYGYCKRDNIPTDMQATCENWKATRTQADFRQRMRSG
jgi:hypothetical protein